MNLGSKVGQKLVVVRKTEKLGERERKALLSSEGKGHDDDYDDICALRLIHVIVEHDPMNFIFTWPFLL